MGYGVGFRDGRWIGYMVPAECDIPDCHEKIDHGMDFCCEEHTSYRYTTDGQDVGIDGEWENEEEIDDEGCGLYFCSEHKYKTELHIDSLQGKPDSPRWLWWILNEDSWAKWREENPRDVARYREETKDFVPDDELLQELADEHAE